MKIARGMALCVVALLALGAAACSHAPKKTVMSTEIAEDDAKDANKKEKVTLSKAQMDRQIAENAGLLGALSDGAEMEGVFGAGALDSELTGGIGGLIGAKGTEIGAGGLGMRGGGLGGGGNAEGLGGLGGVGYGRGHGRGGGGVGGGAIAKKPSRSIVEHTPRLSGLGELDQGLVKAELNNRRTQVMACFNDMVSNHDEHNGAKVAVQFTINASGQVADVEVLSSALGQSFDECLGSTLQTMRFSAPVGGEVVVDHEFEFKIR